MPTPLPIVLERIADELARLHGEGLHAQDAAGLLLRAVSAGTPLPDAALVGLQELDALTQHLAALSAFLSSVAAALPNNLNVDPGLAAWDLPLVSLRTSLLGEAAPECHSNTIELF